MPRAITTATIAFGLVSINVKFYTAAEAAGVSFKMITPKGNTVKRPFVDGVTGEEVTFADCDKGYEIAKDEYITFKAAEIKALDADCDSKAIEIKEFVTATSLDPLWVEKTYYLGPDKGADRSYLLLSDAMTRTARIAVAQWNSRGREHLVVIRPYKGGLVLHQMFYSDEIRPFDEIEVATKTPVSTAEIEMACKLVTAYSTEDFDASPYKDGYVERVLEAVERKKGGGTVIAPPAGEKATASVLDLGTLLSQSLDTASKRKPAKVTPIGRGKKDKK